MTDDVPQASVYLRMLWGADGGDLGKPPPAPAPPPIQPIRPARQCVNNAGQPKARHRTEVDAGYSMKLIKGRPGYVETPNRPLHIYECPLCGFWHVGRTPVQKPPKEGP